MQGSQFAVLHACVNACLPLCLRALHASSRNDAGTRPDLAGEGAQDVKQRKDEERHTPFGGCVARSQLRQQHTSQLQMLTSIISAISGSALSRWYQFGVLSEGVRYVYTPNLKLIQ